MMPIADSLPAFRRRCRPYLDRLRDLFQQMDRAYESIAERYGFHCTGCRDNCCRTRFYHHTLLEFFYLLEGMRQFDPAERRSIREAALTVTTQMEDADRRRESLRAMCPLNRSGRCRLYDYRPMICRLHGIPHELHRPDGRIVRNPGCDAFFDQCRETGKSDYIPFDRTPLYRQMALLEDGLRRETGYSQKIKLTIAQMLAALTEDTDEID